MQVGFAKKNGLAERNLVNFWGNEAPILICEVVRDFMQQQCKIPCLSVIFSVRYGTKWVLKSVGFDLSSHFYLYSKHISLYLVNAEK